MIRCDVSPRMAGSRASLQPMASFGLYPKGGMNATGKSVGNHAGNNADDWQGLQFGLSSRAKRLLAAGTLALAAVSVGGAGVYKGIEVLGQQLAARLQPGVDRLNANVDGLGRDVEQLRADTPGIIPTPEAALAEALLRVTPAGEELVATRQRLEEVLDRVEGSAGDVQAEIDRTRAAVEAAAAESGQRFSERADALEAKLCQLLAARQGSAPPQYDSRIGKTTLACPEDAPIEPGAQP